MRVRRYEAGVFLCVSALAVLLLAGSTHAAPGSNGRIAYTQAANDPITGALFTRIDAVDADGGNHAILAGTADRPALQPSWAPDGARIAFQYGGEVATMKPDGTDIQVLTSIGDAYDPAWSWDGTKIAYGRVGPGKQELWAMNADGSDQHLVYPGPVIDLSWSSTGQITFQNEALGAGTGLDGGNSEIWTVEPDGSDLHQLTVENDAAPLPIPKNGPAWAPDGSYLLFDAFGTTDDGVAEIGLWEVDADGANERFVRAGDFANAVVSPDGTKIVAQCITGGVSNVCEMNADGSGDPMLVTTGGRASLPDWQPAGRDVGGGSGITVAVAATSPNGGAPDGSNGWFVRAPVTGTVTAADTGSKITSLDCGTVPLATTGLGTESAISTFSIAAPGITTVSCTGTDAAGSSGSGTLEVKLDASRPELAPAVSPNPVALGGAAAASPNASDAESGIDSAACEAVDTSVPGTHTVSCRAVNGAGLEAVQTASYTVLAPADAQPPMVTIALPAPNGDGWFTTSPVVGTITADDAATGGSAVTSIQCGALSLATTGLGTTHAAATFSAADEGITTLSCTATDALGNTSSPAGPEIKVDTVAPTLAPTITPDTPTWQSAAVADPNATDATSGIAVATCSPVDTSRTGGGSVDCTARDVAGNLGEKILRYTVPDLRFSAGTADVTLGEPLQVQSIDPCPTATSVDFEFDVTGSGHASLWPNSLPVAADGTWSGTIRVGLGPVGLTPAAFQGQLFAICSGPTGFGDTIPVSLTVEPPSFTADATDIATGSMLRVQSVDPCPGAEAVVLSFFLPGTFSPTTIATLPVSPDGSWSGTLTLPFGPQGQLDLQASCGPANGPGTAYQPVALNLRAPAFAADVAEAAFGSPIAVQSIDPCPGATSVAIFIDTGLPSPDPQVIAAPVLAVAPDGSWSGVVTLPNTTPPQVAHLGARCFGSNIAVSDTPIPFTVVSTDTQPPLISFALTDPNGGVPNGTNGWFTSGPVIGAVTVDDSTTGGAAIVPFPTSICFRSVSGAPITSLEILKVRNGNPDVARSPFDLETDGVEHLDCTGVDIDGNTATGSFDVRLDGTPPAISFAGNTGSYTVLQAISITCTASDATSGVATRNCPSLAVAAWTETAGQHTLSATAIDVAGNTSSASTTFTVTATTNDLQTLMADFVHGSPAYKHASAARQTAADKQLASFKADLAKIAAASGPKKPALVNAFRARLQALVEGGYLTAQQANALFNLAGSI